VSSSAAVDSFLRGEISRRTLVRRLVAAGLSLSAAVSYSELLRPEWAFASHECTDEFYDLYGHYGDCGNHYEQPPKEEPKQDQPKQEQQQDPPPAMDSAAPGTRMKVSKLSLAALLVTNRIVVRFTSNEAATVAFTATMAVAGRSGAAEASRRIVAARGSARFRSAGTKRVRLKLTRRGRKALLRRRRATLRISSRAVDAAGNARVRAVTVKLH
jgi:hypothetical protein